MEPKKSAFSTALKYAIITALASFIFSLVIYLTHMYLNSWIQWVGLVILFIGLIFVVRERRDKDLNGYITFGEAFSAGFVFCMILAVLGVLTNLLMTQVIATDMMPEILKNAEQQMIDRGMPDDQIQIAMKYTKMFTTPMAQVIIGILFTAFFGAIFSLIVAAIFRKNNPSLQPPL
jgi:drug/metabolite transporter (DMT)-like permease